MKSNLLNNKKGLSVFVAIFLFILVTVISVIAYQNWIISYGGTINEDARSGTQFEAYNTKIQSVSDSVIYVKNVYPELEINEIYVAGTKCDYRNSFTSGDIIKIDIEDCIDGRNLTSADIVIVTDDIIISSEKKVGKYDPLPPTKIEVDNTTVIGATSTSSFNLPKCTPPPSEFVSQPSKSDLCFTDSEYCETEFSNKGYKTYARFKCVEYNLEWYYAENDSQLNESYGHTVCYNNTVPTGSCSEGETCEYNITVKGGNTYYEYVCDTRYT